MAIESCLLKLPRELRDCIYDLTLLGEQPIRVKSELQIVNEQGGSGCLASSSALILACKQLHQEYTETFHATQALRGDVRLEANADDADFRCLIGFGLAMSAMQVNAVVRNATLHVKLAIGPTLSSAKLIGRLEEWYVSCKETGMTATYEFAVAKGDREHESCFVVRCLRMRARHDESEEGSKVSEALDEWLRKYGVPNYGARAW
ncbi:hypothetical protein LTR85_003620 [Meristemomyces frigidus]|nr:hypothetical protein LTR85_003620 [Meristemomyces frigidus]